MIEQDFSSLSQEVAAIEQDFNVQINVSPVVCCSPNQVVISLWQAAAAMEQDFTVQINDKPKVSDSLCQVVSSWSQAIAGRRLVETGRCSH